MSAITTRSSGVTGVNGVTRKDAPLTNLEIDANFIAINTTKVETTDAVSTNTASAVVRRDASGNFSAGTVSASLSGTATSATNIVGGGTGSIPYQSNSGTTALLTAGTNGQLLRANGAAAPSFIDQSTIAAGSAGALTTSRNISISTGATGTATAFNGTSDIIIPITALDAGYISAGTLPIARLGTAYSLQLNSLGVGTAATGTAGEIRATNQITAYYSDERLKTKIAIIENALEALMSLDGVTYHANDVAASFGYDTAERQVGVLAQQVLAVQPEIVKPAPFDIAEDGSSISGESYLTVQYERLIPLIIQAVKELNAKVDRLGS
jgi:hypothetical protein